MLVVMFGPPGAGKGTQSERLRRHLQVPHLSTGEMLREARAKGTKVGLMAAEYIDQGQLAPDHLVISVVGGRLDRNDCQCGCLLDGFPRTVEQARSLDHHLGELGKSIDAVIDLEVDDEELIDRLLKRGRDSEKPRHDDNLETIQHRLEVYHEQTEPLINYYRQRGILRAVDGHGTPDEVFGRIQSALATVLDEAEVSHAPSEGHVC